MKKLKQTVLKLSHCWIYANNFNYLKKITVKIMYFLHFYSIQVIQKPSIIDPMLNTTKNLVRSHFVLYFMDCSSLNCKGFLWAIVHDKMQNMHKCTSDI